MMRTSWLGRALVGVALGCGIGRLSADVTMPAIFDDHMVLQQSAKLPIWGTAAPGENVTVTIGGDTGSATADGEGKWMVSLAKLPASTTPTTLTVKGKNTLTFSDVLVGDVWVCSGQSNMEFGIGNEYDANDQIAKADHPLLRLFLVLHKTSFTPASDIPRMAGQRAGHWVVCTPENVKNIGGWNGFSGVGYFFGSEIQKTTGQPVGLIGTYWGGTPAQSWTSLETLKSVPTLAHYATLFASTEANFAQASKDYPAKLAAYNAELAKWKEQAGIPPNVSVDNAARTKAAAAKLPPPPKPPAMPDGGPWNPSSLYNGMIAPLVPYAIKGAIWYQGESNAGQGVEYATLFPDMITDWREKWGEGDFPFLFVQLAKYADPNVGFAQIREAQLKTLSLTNTGMAVAYDVGDEKDIHPKDKYDVGQRLALAARHLAYGQDLVYSGPIYDKMQVDGGAIRVSFTQVGGGLVIGKAPWTPPGAPPLPDATLAGFTIAGADQNWAPADAKIDGNSVVVSSPQVPQPVAVRYAYPVAEGNLYNKEGLPASPFRTDDWDPSHKPGTGGK
jgi:sialate O-acetylesterase